MKKIFLISIGILCLFSFLSAQTWNSPRRLTWNSGSSNFQSAAVDSNKYIHLVWKDDTPGNAEIYYKKSTNGGTAWSGAKRLTWKSGVSDKPKIAIDSNDNIHVVWFDEMSGGYEIYYKKSTDGGTTWSGAKRLIWKAGDSKNPVIAIDSSDNIHIIWDDVYPGNAELFYKKSTDGGSSWTQKRITWNSGYSIRPAIAIDLSDNIFIVWVDYTSGNNEIYFKKSTDAGATWVGMKRLTWNSGESDYPAITTNSSGNIHIVWTDDTSSDNEIYYKKSTDGGSSWTTSRLTWVAGASYAPVIAMDTSGYINVIWQDNMSGNFEIYHKRRHIDGSSWVQNRLTWTSGDSVLPGILTYSEPATSWVPAKIHRIFVFWADETPGNFEIYMKSGIF